MSLWKRIQRIGMKAAKFQFTVSLEELNLAFEKNYQPKAVIIVLTRRGRRCTSKPATLKKSSTRDTSFASAWTVPENLEIIATLYRTEKDISFEDKDWTFQIEDIGMSSEAFISAPASATTRRRVLATCNLNLSEFASSLPTQNNLKINLRPASKKVSTATIIFTLHCLMLRSGEATDEDMISLASSMSLTYAPVSAYGSSVGNDCPAVLNGGNASTFHNDFTHISHQLQAMERCPDLHEVDEEEEEVVTTTTTTQKDQKEGLKKQANAPALDRNTQHLQPEVNVDIQHQLDTPVVRPPDIEDPPKVVISQTGQDLLAWCQDVTSSYPGVRVKDLTLCFRSGLALCAIIHNFQPEAIGDFGSVRLLSPSERVRLAFDVAARLGVARVFVDPCEVVRGTGSGPDRLSMMTYLHQLRSHLVARAGVSASTTLTLTTPSSSSTLPQTTTTTAMSVSGGDATSDTYERANQVEKEEEEEEPGVQKPDEKKKIPKKERRVFGDGKPAAERYEQLLTKARNLLLESKSSTMTAATMSAASTISPSDRVDSSSPSPLMNPPSTELNLENEIDQNLTTAGSTRLPSSTATATTTTSTTTVGNLKVRKLKLSNLKLFADGMEAHMSPSTAANADRQSTTSDTPRSSQTEAALIAGEQEALDREAPVLERRLREAMDTGQQEEEALMRRWFQLVSRRNALVHRAYQLSIMEKETALEKTTALLKAELRELMAKEDRLKTPEDRDREELLLKEVVEVVNERDEIIHELDHQEQAFVQEIELGLKTDAITQRTFRNSTGVDSAVYRACVLQ